MFEDYLNAVVVVDTDGPQSYLGLLVAETPHELVLRDVGIFDRRDARADYELYLVEATQFGFPQARREVRVRLARVVAVSRLADVVVP